MIKKQLKTKNYGLLLKKIYKKADLMQGNTLDTGELKKSDFQFYEYS